ncbi:MAG TPA: NAD(P)-dependent oxidoreductase, partial [Chloroflexi bacterium]|nr:NAD(P)-dependent oxidoreductase [Chloroflexota bacterium]
MTSNTVPETAAGVAAEAAAPAATQVKTFLITGGAGFLGINLTRHLLARGHQVVSLDIADFTYPERNQITEIKG